jgi:hypothetical protein
MTDKPHDALFKAAFENPQHAVAIFRGALPAAVAGAIAWDTAIRESGTFIDPELADSFSDLLLSAQMHGGRALLYLLLEHQSTNDRAMPLRIYLYVGRIWERFRKEHPDEPPPLIVPVVVSHAPGGWSAPRSLHEMFEPNPVTIPGLAELVPNFVLTIVDLAHLSNEEIKARALAAFPTLALWALRDARDHVQLLANLGEWAEAFAEAGRTPHGIAALAQLVRYIAVVTDGLHVDAFRAKIRKYAPQAEAAVMTIAEQMRREGEARGRVQALGDMLRKLAARKFGALSAAHEARIADATAEQLERYVERLFAAATIDAVFDEDG